MNAANPALAWLLVASGIACVAGCAEIPLVRQFSPAAPAAISEPPKPGQAQSEPAKPQEVSVESRLARELPQSVPPAEKLELPQMAEAKEERLAERPKEDIARQANLRREAAWVRERYVNAHPELLEDVRTAILSQQIIPGMTSETAFVSLGVPERVTKRVTSAGTSEQWAYPGRYLYFENGILASYTEEH